MTWILLAALGVPLWLVVGGLLLVLWSRRRFRHRPGVFPCRLRLAGPTVRSSRWPRGKRYGYWVHDVLLVHRGLALMRYESLPVANVAGPIRATDMKGLGRRPMAMRLQLDDGRAVDLVAPNHDASQARGPFPKGSMRAVAPGR